MTTRRIKMTLEQLVDEVYHIGVEDWQQEVEVTVRDRRQQTRCSFCGYSLRELRVRNVRVYAQAGSYICADCLNSLYTFSQRGG